jgi:hypothetical protein
MSGVAGVSVTSGGVGNPNESAETLRSLPRVGQKAAARAGSRATRPSRRPPETINRSAPEVLRWALCSSQNFSWLKHKGLLRKAFRLGRELE